MGAQENKDLWHCPPQGSSDFGIVAGLLQNKDLVDQKCRRVQVGAGPSATLGVPPRLVVGRHCGDLIFGQSMVFSFVQLCHQIKQFGFFLSQWMDTLF